MKKAHPISKVSLSRGNHSIFHGTENPRWLRAISALLKRSVRRKDLDSIAGCANAPDIIHNLRKQGLQIPCTRISMRDRDNKLCQVGVYYFSDSDRRKVVSWLKRRELV
jgi:hypothetical protein